MLMKYSVDPLDLQASSRQLRHATNQVLQVPGGVRNALIAVDGACGDEGCSSLSFNLATKWELALGMLVDGGGCLADSLATAGGAYSRNEALVLAAMRSVQ